MDLKVSKLVEAVAGKDRDTALKLAARITEELKYAKPEDQWKTHDAIVSSLLGAQVLWSAGLNLPKLVENIFFFYTFKEADVRQIARTNSSLFLGGSIQAKEELKRQLVEIFHLSERQMLEKPHMLSATPGRVQRRWEYICEKAPSDRRPRLSAAQVRKLLIGSDKLYIEMLVEMGLDANVEEYKREHVLERKPPMEKGAREAQAIIPELVLALAKREREKSFKYAEQIDRMMGANKLQIDEKDRIKTNFMHQVLGVYLEDIPCSYLAIAQNTFFLEALGISDYRSFAEKNLTLMRQKLSSRWGLVHYLIADLGYSIEEIWESPSKLLIDVVRLIPRHQYYLLKSSSGAGGFGKSGFSKISHYTLSQNGDEAFLAYLKRGGIMGSLEEYSRFRESSEVRYKMESCSKIDGPTTYVRFKIGEALEKKRLRKSNFYTKME